MWDCNFTDVTPETEKTSVTDMTTSQDQAEPSARLQRPAHVLRRTLSGRLIMHRGGAITLPYFT